MIRRSGKVWLEKKTKWKLEWNMPQGKTLKVWRIGRWDGKMMRRQDMEKNEKMTKGNTWRIKKWRKIQNMKQRKNKSNEKWKRYKFWFGKEFYGHF